VKAKQVSVFVENKPGRLVAILQVLEKKDINIRGMSVGDAADIGIVRLILTDPDEGFKELQQAGFTVRIDTVLCAEVPDVPGGLLHSVADPIAKAGVNLLYFYAYTEPTTNRIVAVVKTDDMDKAEEALKSKW
jgi:hypothetical protein